MVKGGRLICDLSPGQDSQHSLLYFCPPTSFSTSSMNFTFPGSRGMFGFAAGVNFGYQIRGAGHAGESRRTVFNRPPEIG